MEDSYVVFFADGGLGKIVAASGVVRAIKEQYPDRKIIVVTPWIDVFFYNPDVYRTYPTGMTTYFYDDYIKGKNTIILKSDPYFHTNHIYQRQNLIKSWCESLGIKYNNQQPKLYFSQAELNLVQFKYNRQKPILILQNGGGPYDDPRPYSWTRDIPFHQAVELAAVLKDHFHILQVTRKNAPVLPGCEKIGEISKRELFLLLMISQKRILIDSCLQHAAAAMSIPSTVLWIGTSPTTFGYPIHTNIKTNAEYLDNFQNIQSVVFDHDLHGFEHLYPYKTTDLFDIQQIIGSLNNEQPKETSESELVEDTK